MINVTENYGFSKKLVLLSFERCTKPDVEHEIIDWCTDNEKEFQYADSDTTSESSGLVEGGENEVEGETGKL